jgi:lipopolysaccharide/colanic/teichoic acid biosynthesis glycosyltransferase
VFYKQERVTINHQTFQIYKFRSMTVDSEKAGARLAMKQDDRITPIGRIIRRIHFDEVPQLINIFKGEMSFVGPRPERPQIGEKYEEIIPEFCFRLKVKAGLTGYAQVYGKYNTTPYDTLKLDLTYIENYSIWLDLKLILMTIKVLFQKENSEGVDANQQTAIRKEGDASFLAAMEIVSEEKK